MVARALCTILTVSAAAMSVAAAASLEEISNYREYSPQFSSSGQPDGEALKALAGEGFERIVYVAYSDHEHSLPNEDRLVKDLGMTYVQVPVEWNAPTLKDFELVAAALEADADARTLLHCQVNYRASAFSFLYRVLYQGADMAAAKADMNSVWTPNETWTRLIFDVLEAHDRSPDCDGCDWSAGDE